MCALNKHYIQVPLLWLYIYIYIYKKKHVDIYILSNTLKRRGESTVASPRLSLINILYYYNYYIIL